MLRRRLCCVCACTGPAADAQALTAKAPARYRSAQDAGRQGALARGVADATLGA